MTRVTGPDRRAMVLIVVLVVVVALSLGALAFSSLMVAERQVTHTTGRQIQALALAESGIEAARAFLAEAPEVARAAGEWNTNAERFQAVLVVDGDVPRDRGRFSIVAPGASVDSGEIRFGLECESAKLNLNTLLDGTADPVAARNRLMTLPNMTEELADSILDWLDAGDEPREFGAEADYYESLDIPYRPTNGPIACLEELLFVRGVTPSLLYGADRNRNGIVDADESDGSAGAETAAEVGSLGAGWSAYLTLFSRESLTDINGEPKINLNGNDTEELYEQLEEAFGTDWANFIIAYRQQEDSNTQGASGSSSTGSSANDSSQSGSNSQNSQASGQSLQTDSQDSGTSGGSSTIQIEYADRVPEKPDLTQSLRRTFGTVLDLIDASLRLEYDDGNRVIVVQPMFKNDPAAMRDYLPKLMDKTTTDDAQTTDGRVNVNLAPAEVLASVPGLDATLAEAIVAHRPTDLTSLADYQRNATWLLADGLVPLETMKTLLPYLTAGGSVYQVQSVGFFDEGGPAARLQAIVDATESPPRVLSLRNLTPLGRAFDPATLGAPRE